MIDSKMLMENLDWFEEQYQSYSADKNKQFSRSIVFFPRYAVLEVCGWLEMAVDDILLKIYKTKTDEEMSNGKKDLYINNIYGLSNDSFEKIFSNIVGFVSIKKIEKSSMKADYGFLKFFISEIFEKRNRFAHTYSSDEKDPIYKSPKELKKDVKRVEKILTRIEEKLSN